MIEKFMARKGVRTLVSSYSRHPNEQRFNAIFSHFFACDKLS